MDQSRNQAEDNAVEALIDRWRDTGGQERANYQLFLTELCQEQIRAVRDQLETAPMDPSILASHYERKPEKSVTQVLDALTELSMIKSDGNGFFRKR